MWNDTMDFNKKVWRIGNTIVQLDTIWECCYTCIKIL